MGTLCGCAALTKRIANLELEISKRPKGKAEGQNPDHSGIEELRPQQILMAVTWAVRKGMPTTIPSTRGAALHLLRSH
jgi:hypothetical protein